MTFTAKIRRHSPIWNLWRGAHRVGGMVAGVQFSWVAGNDYVTGTLVPAQVAALQGHGSVTLEGTEVETPEAGVGNAAPAVPAASGIGNNAPAATPAVSSGTLSLPFSGRPAAGNFRQSGNGRR